MFAMVQLVDRNQPVGQNPLHLHTVPTRCRYILSHQPSDNSNLLLLQQDHHFLTAAQDSQLISHNLRDIHNQYKGCGHDNAFDLQIVLSTIRYINHLLLVYFGSVDLSFLNVRGCVGLPRLVIVEDHLPHQHHQLMQVLPRLQHKVTRVAGHWHKHIHILTRLKEEEEENEVYVTTRLC